MNFHVWPSTRVAVGWHEGVPAVIVRDGCQEVRFTGQEKELRRLNADLTEAFRRTDEARAAFVPTMTAGELIVGQYVMVGHPTHPNHGQWFTVRSISRSCGRTLLVFDDYGTRVEWFVDDDEPVKCGQIDAEPVLAQHDRRIG